MIIIIIIIIIIITIVIYTHLLKPYPIKKHTVQPTKATKRSSEKVDTFKKKAKPHNTQAKNLQKGKHHSAANKGDRREQKDGRRTHSKNNNNSNNLVPIKIKKKDEKNHQRLYQCTHWHPIDAEKRGAYYMCTVELVLFIFSVLDMF